MSKGPKDLTDFEGHWALTRSIEDRLSGRDGMLTGQASLTPDADGLRYEEVGELTIEGQPTLTAKRVYLWRRGKAGHVIVQFDDGSDFHSFALNRTMPEASHWCDPDMYHVTYDFSRWPRWISDWRVQGPKKNYRMSSHYRR